MSRLAFWCSNHVPLANSVVPVLESDIKDECSLNCNQDSGALKVYDMNPCTLCFADVEYEASFIRTTMRYGLIRIEAFNAIFLIYLIAEFFVNTYDIRDSSFILDLWSTTSRNVYNVFCVFILSIHMSCCIFMRLIHWKLLTTTIQCEHVFAADVASWFCMFPFINRWRVVALFGSDREASFPTNGLFTGYVDDAVALSGSLAVIGYVSLVIPIRLHTSFGLMAVFSVSVAWSTIISGAPKENNPAYNYVGMMVYLAVVLMVKRDLDRSVRLSYVMDVNAYHSSALVKKVLAESESVASAKPSMCRLELAREKLMTLEKCISCDEPNLMISSEQQHNHKQFKCDLIQETLALLNSPHNLLSRASETSLPVQELASLMAIKKFIAENFNKDKDAVTDDETQSGGEIYYSETESRTWGSEYTDDSVHKIVSHFGKDFLFSVTRIYRRLGNRTLVTLLAPEMLRFVKSANAEILSFTNELSSKYSSTSYHNEAHAIQVVNHGEYLARMLFVSQASTCIERLSFLIATASHDVGHFGRNNKFCIATGHEVAITYNDTSVLENMHAAITFRLLREPQNNILKNFSHADCRTFRSFVIELILATDMSLNVDAMSVFRLRSKCDDFCISLDMDRRFCYRMIMKCADIGHGALAWEDHVTWSYWLCAEFFEQGDEERVLNLPISALCDRSNCDFAASQQGFLRYCCIPLFECLSVMPPALEQRFGTHSFSSVQTVVHEKIEAVDSEPDSNGMHSDIAHFVIQQVESNFKQWKNKAEQASQLENT